MKAEDYSLLKEEYLHLQQAVEDFDQRGLTIKAWSVTTSMLGIGLSFQNGNSPVLCLLAAAASLSFWLTEASWKSFQQCYYPRLRAIEKAFREPDSQEKPLQISTEWSKAFHADRLGRFFRVFFFLQVMLPHALIVVGGVLIWLWRR
jgi:hypothetical protein